MKTMKRNKYIYKAIFSVLACSIGLSSCNTTLDSLDSPKEYIDTTAYTFYESFAHGLGKFVQKNDSGTSVFGASKYDYVMMNGTVDSHPTMNVDWLVSPAIQLKDSITSVVSFEYVARGFADVSKSVTVWATDSYSPDSVMSKIKWVQISPIDPISNNSGWKMANTGEISLKAFKGKKVYVAIRYESTNTNAGILQVRNFIVRDRVPVVLPYSESFTTSRGKFIAVNVSGAQFWAFDSHGYMNMSGYASPTNYANEDWLISPQIDMTKVTSAKMKFEYVTRYFGVLKNEATVWVSPTYEEGLPSSVTDWKQVKTYPLTDATSWNFSNSYELDLSEYAGKKIAIAFKYLSTNTKAGTWELKNFSVTEGAPSDVYLYEAFDTSLGKFTTDNKVGAQTWYFGSSSSGTYALCSGFANSVSNANEDWLISPTVDLSGKTSAKLSFDHTINKGLLANKMTNHTLWVSADNGTTWGQLTINAYPTGNNWTFVNSGDIVIPDKYLVSTFKFAFKYLCSTSESASWEIRNVVLKK
ncbi:MAG: hypothetical protein RIS29_980 [Bacteroidota bacterium]|jgi:hypothetical protein